MPALQSTSLHTPHYRDAGSEPQALRTTGGTSDGCEIQQALCLQHGSVNLREP